MKQSVLIYLFSLLCIGNLFAQTESPEFIRFKTSPKTSILPDFSYAGYHNGEKAIDYSAKNLPVFNVTAYGAVANDAISDKNAIKAAVADIIASNVGGILFFPPGRFIVQGTDDDNSVFELIRKSNIVLKGSGSGPGGTELFMQKATFPVNNGPMYASPSMFNLGGVNAGTAPRTATKDAETGDFNIELANTADLLADGWLLFEMTTQDAKSYSLDLGLYSVDPTWTELTNGVKLSFVLQIKQIVGNVVTLKQPLPYPIKSALPWKIQKYLYVEEIGIEDIAFVGNFTRPFVHHGSAEDDSGYSMIQLKRAVNSWIRRCRFTDVSVGVALGINGANITVSDCEITGNGGHEAITNAGATNVLFANITDKTVQGQWHSVGVSKTSMNTVLYNVSYPSTTSFETHASQPRNTLLDNVTGGLLDGRGGGATESMPNHLRNLVFWNYEKTNSDFSNFRFWPNTTYWKIPLPTVIGFHGKPTTFTASELRYQESNGTAVFPTSLYQAQLQLRLANATSGSGLWSSMQSTYDYNLGTNTGVGTNHNSGASETSAGPPAVAGFLPTPPSGTVKVQVTGSTGGSGFSLNNPTDPATASINFTANSASDLNKLSAYGIENSTEIASMFFNIDFNGVATNGTYVWALGNKNAGPSLFTNASAVYTANSEVFTALEWSIKANSIDFKFRESANAANSVKQMIDNTTFTRGGNHKVEVYANNSMVLKTYERSGATYSVPGGEFHLWVNNIQLTYNSSGNFSKSINAVTAAPELASDLVLNSYLFYANASSTPSNNAATAVISKIRINYNTSTAPLTVADGNWVNQTANGWNYGFTAGTAGTQATEGYNLSPGSDNPFLPAPPSGVAQLFIPTSSGASFELNAQANHLVVKPKTSGVTKFSAFNIADGTEIASQTFTITFAKTGATAIKNGTKFVYSIGHRGSGGSTLYSNSNSIFTANNSFSNGVGNLFNAMNFTYNTIAGAYLVSIRAGGTNTAEIAGQVDGGDLQVDVPYKFEVYANNSNLVQAYKRAATNYNVAPGAYHLWITDVNAATPVRYSLKGTSNYDIPKAIETKTTEGDYSILANTALNAFLFNGNSGSDGFAKLVINGGIMMNYAANTLPVSLVSFTGQKSMSGIRLNWKTASELNNEYFEILRSSSALNFYSLTKVTGKGNSNQLTNYTYLDNSPQAGTNYYKLKQVDRDGAATVSDIVVAVEHNLAQKELFSVQLLGANELKAQFKAENGGSARISLHDLAGRKVFTTTFAAQKGSNNINLKTSSLGKGVYVATLINDGKTMSIKVIK